MEAKLASRNLGGELISLPCLRTLRDKLGTPTKVDSISSFSEALSFAETEKVTRICRPTSALTREPFNNRK